MNVRAMPILVPAAALLIGVMCASGCTRRNPDYCDNTSDCPSGEKCDLAAHMCLPSSDAALPSDGWVLADAPPGPPAFDVAYPHEWKFSVAGPISGYVVIINTSDAPLSTSSLALKSITDDHPTAVVRVTVTEYDATIAVGKAGGLLSIMSRMILVDSGKVPEPRVETMSDYLTLEIGNAPEGTYDIQAMLTLSLDNVDIPMPMTIHMVPGPEVWANPLAGKRVMLTR
jgi:hypothetical protein